MNSNKDLNITNRVSWKNLEYMLLYILNFKEFFKTDNKDKYRHERDYHVYYLITSLLLNRVDNLIRRGMLQYYEPKTEELSTIRGKIRIIDSVRKMSFQRGKVICDFDEFDQNIYFNQIVKSTLLFLMKEIKKEQLEETPTENIKESEERKEHRERALKAIKNSLLYFSNVREINVKTVKWGDPTLNRFSSNSRHYGDILSLCEHICSDFKPLAKKNYNNKDLPEHEIVYWNIFESFVYQLCKRELPSGYQVVYQESVYWDWKDAQGLGYPKGEKYARLPSMRTDIIVKNGENGDKVLIIDTKFYGETLQNNPNNTKGKTIRSDNLYQLFAYVENKKKGGGKVVVSGMLLYPEVNADDKLGATDDCSIFDSNYHFRTIDLKNDFEAIREVLTGMIGEILAS